MEVISIERSTYEELHPRLTPAPYQGTSNVSQMKAMAGRGTDKRLGEWLDRSNSVRLPKQEPGRVPDTEHKPKNVADAPSKRNVGLLSNRA